LPLRQAQWEFSKFDFSFRDISATFMDFVTPKGPTKPEVPDVLGSEEFVFASTDAAARLAGLDVTQVSARASQLEVSEARRMRGRVAVGLFETELLGSLAEHMVSQTQAPAFQEYCRWRAYQKALEATIDPEAASVRFRTEFGRHLLAADGFLAAAAPLLERPRVQATLEDTEALVAGGGIARAGPAGGG